MNLDFKRVSCIEPRLRELRAEAFAIGFCGTHGRQESGSRRTNQLWGLTPAATVDQRANPAEDSARRIDVAGSHLQRSLYTHYGLIQLSYASPNIFLD